MRAAAIWPALAALGTLLSGAVAQAQTNVLYLNSQPGDFIGEGQVVTYTDVDGAFTAAERGFDQTVWVDFTSPDSSWSLAFAAPEGAPVAPGMYEAATREAFHSPTRPGLDVSGNGEGCNTLTGRFVVLEATYDGDGNVLTFAADFEQHCENLTPALYGAIRFNSSVPIVPVLSIANAAVFEGPSGAPMNLTVSLSGPAPGPVTVGFATADDTAQEGTDYVAASGTLTFTPPETAKQITIQTLNDGIAAGEKHFRVSLSSPAGAAIAYGTANASILDSEGPRSFLILDSQPGDFIGGGLKQSLTTIDGVFTPATYTYDKGVHLHFESDTWWDLAFEGPKGAAPAPGMYEGAIRFSSQGSIRPGLDVSGDGRGCNELVGRFVVFEATYNAGGDLMTFAADFEQHCEGHTAALYGAIRFNSSVEALPRLSIGDAAVAEGAAGAPMPLIVSLSAPVSGPVTVDFSTSDGTALAGSDYVATSGSVSFSPGQTSQQIAVQTLNDHAAQGDEHFYVTLGNPSGAAIGYERAKGTIWDSESLRTFLRLDSQPGDYVGQGLEQRLTELDGDFGVDVFGDEVYVHIGGDRPWRLLFQAPRLPRLMPGVYENAVRCCSSTSGPPGLDVSGESRSCDTLTGRFVVYEAVYDGAGNMSRFAANFEQHCDGAAPALYGAVRYNSSYPVVSATMRPGQFEFSAPSYSVAEGAGVAVIAVKRTLGTAGPAKVDYSTDDGTAAGGADYTATSGTLTLAAGQTVGTFRVPLTKDAADEPNETVVLRLSNPQPALHGATLGPQSTAVLTIVDDDAGGAVQFSPVAYSVNGAAGATSARLTVRRTGGLASGVSVTCTMADGTATGGVDYDSTPQTLTFASAGTAATTQILTIPISQNTSGTKTFTVTLSAPTGAATLGAATVATVTILGAHPTVAFSSAAYGVKTTQAGALITVKRSAPATGTVTVHYATSPGTATNGGGDYTDVSGTLTFGPSVLAKSFTVPITKDPLVDVPKTVNLTLDSPTWSLGTAVLDPPRSTAMLTITNPNLAPVVQFGGAAYAASEATPRVTLAVRRTGNLVGTVTVAYAVTGGTATNADPLVNPESDYQLASGVLTFGPNVVARSLTIPIVNDIRMEGTETAAITLSDPTWTGGSALVGALATTTLSIIDNEPAVQFAQAAYTVGEAARAVTIAVKRTGSAVAAATVGYAVTGGTAIPDTGAGGDYVAPPPGTLSFLPGQLQKTLVITLEPDTWVDGLKTIDLALSSPSGAALGTPSTTTIRITDDDLAGKVQLGAAVISVTEASGTATITVTRTGGTAGPVTVEYATLDSGPGTTAVAGTDYTSTSGTLTFNWSEKSRAFTVPIIDDGETNPGAVSVGLALSAPGSGLSLGSPSTAALWIVKE